MDLRESSRSTGPALNYTSQYLAIVFDKQRDSRTLRGALLVEAGIFLESISFPLQRAGHRPTKNIQANSESPTIHNYWNSLPLAVT